MHLTVNEQIHLTENRATDREAVVEHLRDKAIYDRTLRIPYPYTEADFDRWMAIDAEATAKHGQPVFFAIRESGGGLIGGVGLELGEGPNAHLAEIGYWLARPYWGRGIMTSVVAATCAHGFAEFGLVRIEAHVFDFNDASARVLEKNGFALEGVLRKFRCKDGRYLDAKLYALVRETPP